MTPEDLRKALQAETAGRPFRGLADPVLVSAKPTFRG